MAAAQPTPRADTEARPSTLLALVQELLDAHDAPEVVETQAAKLVARGAVVLTGNFRGQILDPA